MDLIDDIENEDSGEKHNFKIEKGIVSHYPKGFQFILSILIAVSITVVVGLLGELVLSAHYGMSGGEIIKNVEQFLNEFKGQLNYFRLVQMANTVLLFGGSAFLMSFLISGKIFGFFDFSPRSNKNSVLYIPLMMITILPVVAFIAQLVSELNLSDGLLEMEKNTILLEKGLIGIPSLGIFIINFFMIAIFPGIFEELYFRGILQKILIQIADNNRLKRYINSNFGTHHIGIVATGLIFGGIHGQITNFLPISILGILLGYIYWWTKNLWFPIFAHLFFNGIQAIGLYALTKNPNLSKMEEMETLPPIQTIISIVLFLGLTYLFYQSNKNTTNGIS